MENTKKHHFSHTEVELHDDGSATMHHVHESGDSRRDVKHAVADMDGLHDCLEDHLNPDDDAYAKAEAAEEMVSPGIHQKIAEMGFPEKS